MPEYHRLLKSVILATSFCIAACGQVSAQIEDSAVINVVNKMFTGMRKGDSSMIRSTFLNCAFMSSFSSNAQDSLIIRFEKSIDSFLKGIGTSHNEIWDERIDDVKILRDGPMAVVWAPYKFYLGDRLSHCGTNVFTLVKTKSGWKIREITDTGRKDNCH